MLTKVAESVRKFIETKEAKRVLSEFYPCIIKHMDKHDLELSTKQRSGYLVVFSKDNLTADMLENSDYRVCSEHCVNVEPAKLYDFTNPNWLPMINLGHGHMKQKATQIMEDMSELREEQMSKG